jgi:hypothetical protein
MGNKAHLRPHRKKRQASRTTGLLLLVLFIALVALATAVAASGHAILPAGRIVPLRGGRCRRPSRRCPLCARSLGRCRALAVTRGRCNLPAGQHSGKSAHGRLRPPKQRVAGQFHDAPDAGGRHRHSQAPRRGARVAGRGVPRHSHGYKTRVFTGAICPVPHQTGTVVSKGAPTCQEPQPTSSPSSSSRSSHSPSCWSW